MSDVIVRVHHLRSVPGLSTGRGYCRAGAKKWCAARGIDWRRFVREGISANTLRATGDALALRLVEHAEQQEARRG